MAGNTAGPRSAVIVGGNRIPFARAIGPYTHASNQDMLIAAFDGLVARSACPVRPLARSQQAPYSSTAATST